MRALLLLMLLAAPAGASAQTAPPAPEDRQRRDEDAPLTAAGARAAENAVRQAGDAFGTVVGREEVGLYSADEVRGFSPVVAGNVRIAGLYFDPVIFPSDRISGSTVIRVGPTALGSPFPAPTGIVDLGLRIPGDRLTGSLQVGADSFGTRIAEMDLALPVSERFSLGVGARMTLDRFVNRARDNKWEGALIARWRPSDAVEIVPFVSVAYTPLDDSWPGFAPAGETLPPRLPRRLFLGPDWAITRDLEVNAGGVLDWRLGDGWTLKAGLFRSSVVLPTDFTNLLQDVEPDGGARRVIIADPQLFFASTSGEARLTRTVEDGAREHQIHLALRGRQAFRRFDGSVEVDLGPTTIRTPSNAPKPDFAFLPQQFDRVRQWTGALGYDLRWTGVGALSASLQRTEYLKRIGPAGAPPIVTDTTPLLWNVNAAVEIAPWASIYGGAVTGLEESGVAPGNAANRNEALPAILTRQIDMGVRLRLARDLQLTAGLFQVSKPYFNLDDRSIFRELGTVTNRGLEASLAGAVTPRVSVVLGAVLLDPRVSGEAVARGISGVRPVGAVGERVEFGADWRPPWIEGLSLDMNLSYRSAETATVSNRVAIPGYAWTDLGGRYRFKLAGTELLLRLQVSNLFDQQGWWLRDAGLFDILPGRLFQAFLTLDF